jgi:hypothetical protein
VTAVAGLGHAAGECGSVVAEFAVALPAVLLVLATVLGRGDTDSAVSSRIARQAPSAHWSVSRPDGLVCVHLAASAAPPAGVLGLEAAASSCALDETSAVP